METPEVRKVRVRLEGDDADAVQVAEMLANLLPAMSQGRYQLGDLSPSYPNRRHPGARRYLDLYILRAPDADGPTTGAPPSQSLAVPDTAPRRTKSR